MNNRAHQLHSSYLETLGLASAIQGFCGDFSKQHGITVDFVENGIGSHIPSNVSLCVFRIVQEGLQNVAKHSQSKLCRVELTTENHALVLRIVDSGVGFDPAGLGRQTGLGLVSMRERLRLVNGKIQLSSSPKHGTSLEIQVPVNEKPGAGAA
jgi:signal transduction histidine kinase